MTRRALRVDVVRRALAQPFNIAGMTIAHWDVISVEIAEGPHVGRAEGNGVFFLGETVETMRAEIEAQRAAIEAGLTLDELQRMAPGGARNALDCALWDLQAQISGRPVWELVGIGQPKPLLTTFTCSAEPPDVMAATAAGPFLQARAIKLKLTGDPIDAERVTAVHAARPDVWLSIDANRGCDLASLERLMPTLAACGIKLIEQPFPIGDEHLLDGFGSPIPIAADESVLTGADLEGLVGRFDVANIKLDKCGGLTEALSMVERAKALGLDVMVGNMMASSLGVAPAFVVGQLCTVVDLDGPIFFAEEGPLRVEYRDGYVDCPPRLWGYPAST